MIITIGLTGSIATGKSTASSFLKEMGCKVIDGDLVAREVAETPEVREEIKNVFGEEFLDKQGKIRRKKLGSLVFSDQISLTKLNKIMHPAIQKEIAYRLETFKNHCQKNHGIESEITKPLLDSKENPSDVKHTFSCIIVDGALLIEMGLHVLVDEVWVISISEDEQVRRLMKRDKVSRNDALKRIKSQMSTDEKKNFADVVLNNNRSPEYLQEQIQREILRVKERHEKP